jgi:HK97 family phage prohead protease
MNRAYSMLEAKAFDTEKRTFKGWATTPAADRVSDRINPLGAQFKNPLVLLHQHNHESPIGTVTFGKPTAKGIEFEAHIPEIEEAGPLKDRVDTAWGEIRHGLVRAVSIGFRPLKYAYMENGGIDFQEIEIFELSSVSIPANAEAVITAVKSLDHKLMAEAGIDPASDPDPEIPERPADVAATGKSVRVVRLDAPARDRAKPFVIREIKRA